MGTRQFSPSLFPFAPRSRKRGVPKVSKSVSKQDRGISLVLRKSNREIKEPSRFGFASEADLRSVKEIQQKTTKKRMKKNIVSTAVAAFILSALPAAYGSVEVLTFEGLQSNEAIDNYYNGGLGGNGSGPGPNYGITFTPDSLALISSTAGGGGNFQNNPSGGTTAYFLTGAGDIMNVAGGFDTGFSFYYCSIYYAGSVTVWSGLNGTGTELASLSLAITPEIPGEATDFDNWAPVGVSFSGTAESVNFSGTANQIGFDNITLGTNTPVVPEVSTWGYGLVTAGVMGISMLRNRRSAC